MTSTPPPMASPRMASGALFFDEAQRVLLVKPTYKDRWEIPGGYVEPGESPHSACVREVREELGIKPPIGPLLVVDWAPAPDEGDKVLFIFDGGQLYPEDMEEIQVDPTEIRTYEFHDMHELDQLLIPRLARRVGLAISACCLGRTFYAEHGIVTPTKVP